MKLPHKTACCRGSDPHTYMAWQKPPNPTSRPYQPLLHYFRGMVGRCSKGAFFIPNWRKWGQTADWSAIDPTKGTLEEEVEREVVLQKDFQKTFKEPPHQHHDKQEFLAQGVPIQNLQNWNTANIGMFSIKLTFFNSALMPCSLMV